MKNQLQLLGTVCMLLASKLRESKPLAGETLVYYTDHSVTKEQLWVREFTFSFCMPTAMGTQKQKNANKSFCYAFIYCAI